MPLKIILRVIAVIALIAAGIGCLGAGVLANSATATFGYGALFFADFLLVLKVFGK